MGKLSLKYINVTHPSLRRIQRQDGNVQSNKNNVERWQTIDTPISTRGRPAGDNAGRWI